MLISTKRQQAILAEKQNNKKRARRTIKLNSSRPRRKKNIKYNREQVFKSWQPEAIYPDSTIYILGGGPSLNKVNFDLIKDKVVIGVNNSYGDPIKDQDGVLIKYVPRDWVNICWFGDTRWWNWHEEYLADFKGLIFSCSPKSSKIEIINNLKRGKPKGIETNGNISWNKSSGGSAINLAYYLGAKQIVLLGYDMKQEKGHNNWHTDHKNAQTKGQVYQRFITAFPIIKEEADGLGLKIYNGNPDSALTVFPFINLEEFVKNDNII